MRDADVLLVDGGEATYLSHWIAVSGLGDLLVSLTGTVWVGMSAGSMVMTPQIGEDFMSWSPPDGPIDTLGVVDFSIFPHLDHVDMPENTLDDATRWAAGIDNPAYAIDDQTALRVVDGVVDVVFEGRWRHLP